jgi:Cu-Zn family superoxide dismutase
VRTTWRILVALLGVTALAAGGSIAVADDGPGGKHKHSHKGGSGDTFQAGQAQVFTLSEPQHGNPEGVAVDKRSGTFFVSATGDGAIYRGKLGDTNTPVPVFIAGISGNSATGLKVQGGKLYVAGAATGTIKVYDSSTGSLLATFDTKGGSSAPTFINDLAVTKRGDVYATDSFRPAIYHLTAEEIAAGTPAPKPIAAADVITTTPEIPFDATAGTFNLNGIVVAHGRDHGGDRLIVVDSKTGRLFQIAVAGSGRTIRELNVKGGPFPGGDGLLLDRGRLLVVQGTADGFANGVVDVIKVLGHGRRARLEDRLSDPSLKGPSTIARARNGYLVVNADFATSTAPFTVSFIARHSKHHGHGKGHDRGHGHGHH